MRVDKNTLSWVIDKLPNVVLQLFIVFYLVVIGVFLPVDDLKQLVMKLFVMSLGLFAAWKLHGFSKEKREKSSSG